MFETKASRAGLAEATAPFVGRCDLSSSLRSGVSLEFDLHVSSSCCLHTNVVSL